MKYQKRFFFLCLMAFASIFYACSDDGSSAEYVFDASVVCPENMRGTFTDARDGQVYKYTTIGNQVWMAENLRFDDGSWCAEDTCSVKGRIYEFENALNACPTGWHLPSGDEWNELFNSVGGADSAGMRLKATAGWTPLNPGQLSNGTDDCGFALLPIPVSNKVTNSVGGEKHDGYITYLWTTSPGINDYIVGVLFETPNVYVQEASYYGWNHLSARCVKD